MGDKLRVLISQTHNPWFNLATEEWIFRDLDPSVQTLFLWRNAETVVIGRNQNPWSECNLARMEKDGLFLARRSSGGGAVFQDLGNTCFTFLSPKDSYSRDANNAIVLKALARFGIAAEASGRNDLVVPREDGPRKISGSAFFEARDRAFHHGTLLINTDLTRLANYLTPHPKKLESKGRASVRSRVMNLSEIAENLRHEQLAPALIESFSAHYGLPVEVETLDEETLKRIPSLQGYFAKLSDWNWRFGEAPSFRQEMAEYLTWGFLQVFVDAARGHIEKARVYSDALFPDLVEEIERQLVGRAFTGAGVEETAAALLARFPEKIAEIAEFSAWLKTQVEIN
jgi:lipoate-protein ligase A